MRRVNDVATKNVERSYALSKFHITVQIDLVQLNQRHHGVTS